MLAGAVLLALVLTGAGRVHRDADAPAPQANRTHPAVTGVTAPAARIPGSAQQTAVRTVAATTDADWTGYAFDACRAPSQRVMDRWLTRSPFTGAGIYLGGVQRACDQPHLTASWVRRQTTAGWKLLPLWVGPQASCTGFDHRISGRPGPGRTFRPARADGAREADRAAATARRLGIGRGRLIFYDLEGFDASRRDCVSSSLAFLESWTTELHRLGYGSGVYSHVNAGIRLLSATPRSYRRPDAVWYAWVDRANARPAKYVADPAFMRSPRVHQFALDRRVRFGGIKLDIDWNYVSFGPTTDPTPLLKLGARGASVRHLQQRLNAALASDVRVDGSFGPSTAQAVRRFQARIGHARTSVVTARLWRSLAQPAPVRATAVRPVAVRPVATRPGHHTGRPHHRAKPQHPHHAARRHPAARRR
ncbi:Putative peptidoglycan binding domain-containing protein [Nocardioides terrae]|uniref:Putative peptidoglycan binding domain-containing protein n=1 Tax=Nocardioides terrae TaxID=574651 RepID=A0A1I1EWW0_9ACTN|nr:Putative peptidoglycan binding domain-containing protein [Nocardioides terrae]